MKMKGNILLAVIFTVVCMLSIASKGYSASAKGVTETTIKIGGIFDLTGPIASIIKPVVEGIRNYTRYVNDQGGIHGRKIQLIIEDDRYIIPAAVAAFKKLIYKDEIFTLLGPGSTGETRALMNQIMSQKLPTLALAADRDMIIPYKRYIFLPIDTYDNEIGIIFDYILQEAKPKKPKIALVCVDAGVKAVILKAVKEWTQFFGIEVDMFMLPLNVLDTTSDVLSIKRAKADYIIVVHSIPTIALFLRDSKRFGLNAKIYATYSGTSEDVINIAKKAADNFYGVHPFSSWYDDTPGMAEARKITLHYYPGTEKPYRSKNYSIGWVMANLVHEGIKRAGRNLDGERFIDAMETIKDFDTKGICGLITYTSKSHEGLKYNKVFHADPESGKLVPITDWRKAPDMKE
ncbi:MAG: ABC transporter substrate-binding protein [Desulfobacterales bacterium]|nr:ABC transporter substrate-binding protein [Desulfobacterales bacterium]